MPTKRLSTQQVEEYTRNGVIHVRGALDERWISPVRDAVDRVIKPGKSFGLTHRTWATDDDFRTFAFESGLAELAAEATGSETIRLYFDQIFVKKGNTDMVFAWHQDHPFWPIGGTQIASTWVALTAANADSSALEFVRGSHTWGKTFRPPGSRESLNKVFEGFGDLAMTIPDEVIEFENQPDEYEIISFDVEPGDALLFDYRILHRSRGNPLPEARVAVSWRWLGDDASWEWTHGKEPVVSPDMTFLQPGDLITDDDTFPIVYRAAVST